MASTPEKHQSFSANHRILVIDDDSAIIETLNVYLSNNGYEVNTALNGSEALNSFAILEFDLIICDLRLPDIDGLELINIFNQKSPNVPIIVFSGFGKIKDVVEAIRRGANDYFIKPIVDFNAFDMSIKSALAHENHRLNQAKNLVDATREDFAQELLDIHSAENKQLAQNLQALSEEPETARQIQLQLLPDPETSIGHYHFQHSMIPSPKFGNICLDYFQLDQNFICFYIADVSIHRDDSVFANMLLKSFINQPIRHYKKTGDKIIVEPAKLLKYLNTEMMQSNVGKFISLFYGVIDQRSDTLNYSMAGYQPIPTIINNHSLEPLIEEGLPVGLFEWADYQQHQMKITPDFTLGMFSSGLVDILTNGNDSIITESLYNLCKKTQVSALDIIRHLNLSKKSYFQDDMAVFLVQYQ